MIVDLHSAQRDISAIAEEHTVAGGSAVICAGLIGDCAASAVAAFRCISAVTDDRETAVSVLNADAISRAARGGDPGQGHPKRSKACGTVDVYRCSIGVVDNAG